MSTQRASMVVKAAARRASLSLPIRVAQGFTIFMGGVSLFLLLSTAALIGYDLVHVGVVYPGVSVAGVDLAGLPLAEAEARILERLAYPQTGRIAFQLADQVWVARPNDLGLYLDASNSSLAAYQLGRQGGLFTRLWQQFTAWYWGENLSPILVYDQRLAQNFLASIAAQVDQPTIEASLTVNGTEVSVTPGQVGRRLDIQSSLAPLEAQLRSLSDGLIPLVMEESPPVILDASAQAELARRILSAPLMINLPPADAGGTVPWRIERETLARMLAIERVQSPEGARYEVKLEAGQLRAFLEDLGEKFYRQPENARFIFNDETRQLELIQPAVIGRTLNIDATIQSIQEKVTQGEHSVELVFDYTNPTIGDSATAAELGITELVSAQTSYFYGSSAERIHNIETAAARFHGVLVPPGATFSMGEVLGNVSLDTGYAEALIIFGNRTIQGVGGGVCQVSTTLFRTVFYAGYPVVERHPHAYRVYYYELTRSGSVDPLLAGLDATVFVPLVDFRFANDTPYWLLMETYTNPQARTLTWKFYSTSDGREVLMSTSGLQNVVEPPDPLYQENPELAKGEIEQVDWAVEGADVTVIRTVLRDGQLYFQDEFSTHYLPWRAVYEYGPGTEIPVE